MQPFALLQFMCFIPVPPAMAWLLFQSVTQATGLPLEGSVFLKLVETSIVGAALFGTMFLVWKMLKQYVELSKQNAALAERLASVIEKDTESRGEFMTEVKRLRESSFCVLNSDKRH